MVSIFDDFMYHLCLFIDKKRSYMIISGSIHGVPTTFWKVFFFRFFFAQYAGMVQKTLLVKKKLGPSYQKFRDRGHFLGTCLIL